MGIPGLKLRGKGRTQPKRDGSMNKTEARYALHLTDLLRLGQVARFDFEPEKLRLADRTFYTPDFRVLLPDGSVEFHEVKGFWEDDARVKIKVAADQHPYTFVGVLWKGGLWQKEEF